MIELLLQAERALSVGLLDRAETLYKQVAAADPRNSIAIVGMARVILDRGDEVGALDLARRALSIDAENVAAQRMIARLEEVIDYRAEAGETKAVPAAEAVPMAEAEAVPLAEADAAVDPEAEPASTAAPEPEPEPEPAPEPEPEPEPASASEPIRRRSLLDRLMRRG